MIINLKDKILISINVINIFITIIVVYLTWTVQVNIEKLKSNLNKNSEIETRLYSTKYIEYAKFIDIYYSYFNTDSLKSQYEKNYIKKWPEFIRKIKWSNIWDKYINSILNLKCFYNEPWICNRDISIQILLWQLQNEIFISTIIDQYQSFIENTYKFRLIFPWNIFYLTDEKISFLIEFIKKNYNSCDLEKHKFNEWEETINCWFDFKLISNWYYIKGEYYISSFILLDDKIIEIMKKDLEKFYN